MFNADGAQASVAEARSRILDASELNLIFYTYLAVLKLIKKVVTFVCITF